MEEILEVETDWLVTVEIQMWAGDKDDERQRLASLYSGLRLYPRMCLSHLDSTDRDHTPSACHCV